MEMLREVERGEGFRYGCHPPKTMARLVWMDSVSQLGYSAEVLKTLDSHAFNKYF